MTKNMFTDITKNIKDVFGKCLIYQQFKVIAFAGEVFFIFAHLIDVSFLAMTILKINVRIIQCVNIAL